MEGKIFLDFWVEGLDLSSGASEHQKILQAQMIYASGCYTMFLHVSHFFLPLFALAFSIFNHHPLWGHLLNLFFFPSLFFFLGSSKVLWKRILESFEGDSSVLS